MSDSLGRRLTCCFILIILSTSYLLCCHQLRGVKTSGSGLRDQNGPFVPIQAMPPQMSLQGSGQRQSTSAQTFARRSTRPQTSVLRRAQGRQAAARSRGSQTSTTDSDTWSSSEGGSDTDDSDSEDSSCGRGARPVHGQQQRTGRRQQGPPPRGISANAAAAAAAAAGAAGPAAPAAMPQGSADSEQGPILHKPYSHLVWCHSLSTRSIAAALCTDIEELHSGSRSCSVHVSYVQHPADWDIKGYILQHPDMQQQAAQPSAIAGSSSTSESVGPFQRTLTHGSGGQRMLLTIPVQGIKKYLKSAKHAVVLQERCLSNDGPRFLFHKIPATPGASDTDNQSSRHRMTNIAGEGKGLQVFPGSFDRVAQDGTIASVEGKKRIGFTIPRELVCSQLLANTGTNYPLQMTLILQDSPGSSTLAGQHSQQASPPLAWQVKACKQRKSIVIRQGKHNPLAAFVGCSIATVFLSQDATQGFLLTLTLANTAAEPTPHTPAVAAASAAAQAAAPAPASPQVPAPGLPSPSPAAGVPASSLRGRLLSGSVVTAAAAAATAAPAGPAAAPYPQGEVSPSQHRSAAPQQQPAMPAKRPAAQLEGRVHAPSAVQQGGGSRSQAAAAALGGLLPAAAIPLAASRSSKKPRLQLLLPAGGSDPRDGPSSLCRTPQAAAANSEAAAGTASKATVQGPAGSPTQVDPPAKQQQHIPVGNPQQLHAAVAGPNQQEQPGRQAEGAGVPVLPVLPGYVHGHTAAAPAAAAAAAAAPAPVSDKQEAVIDLSADSDGKKEDGGRQGRDQQQLQQRLPATTHIRLAAPPPGSCRPARTAPSQDGAPAAATAAAVGARAAQQNAAATPAAPGPATPAMPQQLPAGAVLPDAASPLQMELQLGALLTERLQQLLPETQYLDLLDQLGEAFDPNRLAAAVGAEQQQHLRLKYTYVQAAVRSGKLDRVVRALKALFAVACQCTFGIGVVAAS